MFSSGRSCSARLSEYACAEPDKTAHTDDYWSDHLTTVHAGDSLRFYAGWDAPNCIVSDGAYGVLGFEGDTSDHLQTPDWYEPHVAAWSSRATAQTVLWFWNSEIGWAATHPVLERYGWRYVNANIWDKGIGHVAGNVNTKTIRRFPVVSEVCVQYVFEAKVDGETLKSWVLKEWKRTGLPLREANTACGVKDAATRKYLSQGKEWYLPNDKLQMLVDYANEKGDPKGRPYFSKDGKRPISVTSFANLLEEERFALRPPFSCPHGVTNVWRRNTLRGDERIKFAGSSGRAVHPNQKPLDLMTMIIKASTAPKSVVWEPFGGLFSASVAARRLGLRSFASEINPTYFEHGLNRILCEAARDQETA